MATCAEHGGWKKEVESPELLKVRNVFETAEGFPMLDLPAGLGGRFCKCFLYRKEVRTVEARRISVKVHLLLAEKWRQLSWQHSISLRHNGNNSYGKHK